MTQPCQTLMTLSDMTLSNIQAVRIALESSILGNLKIRQSYFRRSYF